MNSTEPNRVLVSAIVPARNEEAVIRDCLDSLCRQQALTEILVVNDHSVDDTAQLVRVFAERDPRVRLIEPEELPTGWVGKNYAAWAGAERAKGDWFLFTDADAVHVRDSAARALEIARETRAALVSFSPEQCLERWYEKALIPYVYCRLGAKFSYSRVNDPREEEAAANGQFLMIEQNVYRGVGGHAAIRAELIEDVALARLVKQAGYPIWFSSGKGIVRVRMYRSFRAMWEGWKKNIYRLMGGSREALFQETVKAEGPELATLLGTVIAWRETGSIGWAAAVLGGGLVVILSAYARQLRRNQYSPWLLRYGIASRLLFTGVLWDSYRGHRKGKVDWKGRKYPVSTSDASNRR